MAAKWTIDNLNKLFILKAGVTELDVEVDLYSDWKEEYKIEPNSAFPIAMRGIGGDPVTAVKDAGATFFMVNGWRIRPDETNHTLNINGNLFTDPAGDSVVVDTLGAFNVRVEMFVSNLVDAVVAENDLAQIVNAVYIDTVLGSPGTSEGIGLPANPVDNITDARTIADRDGIREYRFRGPLTINADHTDWKFVGIGSVAGDELDLNGFDLGSSVIEGAKCTGTLTGQKQQFVRCDLDGVGGLEGLMEFCWLRGSLSGQSNGEVVFADCRSAVPGTASPIYTMSANEQFNMRNYSGGWEHRSSTAGNVSTIEVDPGNIILPASNTGGVIVIRGVGTYTDSSAGATVNTDGFVNSVGLADMINNGVDLKSIAGSALAALLLALGALSMARGTVTVVNSPTEIEVQFLDGFDPEAGDGIAGRALLFTSGLNVRGGARIAAMNGQGAGDPLLTLTYSTDTPPTPTVGDEFLMV